MTQKEKVNWVTHEFDPLLDLVEAMKYLKNKKGKFKMSFNSSTYEKHLNAQLGDWAFVIELGVFIFCFVILPLMALGLY